MKSLYGCYTSQWMLIPLYLWDIHNDKYPMGAHPIFKVPIYLFDQGWKKWPHLWDSNLQKLYRTWGPYYQYDEI